MAADRIQSIDGLRAFAIASVMGVHFLPGYFRGGGIGVDVFFVISGFVITNSLKADSTRSGTIRLKQFYIRRVRRLWPALWVLAAFVLVVGRRFDPAVPLNVAFTLTGTMNWARAIWTNQIGGSLGHAWSLGIEEQFYLIWPLAFAFLLRRRANVSRWLIGAIAAAWIWSVWVILHPPGPDYFYNDLFCRSDGLLLGCLLSISGWRGPQWLSRLWIVPLAALCAIAVVGVGEYALPIVSLLSAWLICACDGPETALHRIMATPPIQWAGLRSYSLYLWHYPLAWYLGFLPFGQHMRFVLILGATVLAAELSYRFIEQTLRVKSRREVSGFAPVDQPAG